jgi:hypothetical protein
LQPQQVFGQGGEGEQGDSHVKLHERGWTQAGLQKARCGPQGRQSEWSVRTGFVCPSPLARRPPPEECRQNLRYWSKLLRISPTASPSMSKGSPGWTVMMG